MQNTLIKNLISSAYANKEKILFESISLHDLDKEYISILEGFHMKELYLIEESDNYFCGIRADHFCVEYGSSEYFQGEDSCMLILVTANHKGWRVMTLLKA